MIALLLAVVIPSILMFIITRLITNVIFDLVYSTIKLVFFSIFKLMYRFVVLILWILLLPLTIVSKMTVRQSSPFRWLILVSLMALSAFVAYDISLHGSFHKSQTGRALEDAGVLKTYEQLSVRAKVQYANASMWFAKNGPTFMKQGVDYIKPYLVLMKNLLIIFSNVVVNAVVSSVKYVAVKLPLLHEAIEAQYPGITERSRASAQRAWQVLLELVQYLAAQTLALLTVGYRHMRQVFAQTFDYLQNNVFVGEYSPENLQKLAIQGASVAQEYVSSSVSWLSHKLTGLATQ